MKLRARVEGRAFDSGRGLIVADGVTKPPIRRRRSAPKRRSKRKWLFTMLATAPDPDVPRYHSWQIVILGRDDWGRWLDPTVPAGEVLLPAPAGTLEVTQIR